MAFAAETSNLLRPKISSDGKNFSSVEKRAFRGVTVRCVSDLKCYNDSLTIKHQAKGMIPCMDIRLCSGTLSAIFHPVFGSRTPVSHEA